MPSGGEPDMPHMRFIGRRPHVVVAGREPAPPGEPINGKGVEPDKVEAGDEDDLAIRFSIAPERRRSAAGAAA
jgi:hypothetical protein